MHEGKIKRIEKVKEMAKKGYRYCVVKPFYYDSLNLRFFKHIQDARKYAYSYSKSLTDAVMIQTISTDGSWKTIESVDTLVVRKGTKALIKYPVDEYGDDLPRVWYFLYSNGTIEKMDKETLRNYI